MQKGAADNTWERNRVSDWYANFCKKLPAKMLWKNLSQSMWWDYIYMKLPKRCSWCSKSSHILGMPILFRKPQPMPENKHDSSMSHMREREAWRSHIILAYARPCIVRLHLSVKSTIALENHMDSMSAKQTPSNEESSNHLDDYNQVQSLFKSSLKTNW